MAKNLLAVSDALTMAEGVNEGLDALVSLLFSAKEADVPSGRAIGELLYSIQKDMAGHLEQAKAGLRDSK